MKKSLAILISLVLVISFCAVCGSAERKTYFAGDSDLNDSVDMKDVLRTRKYLAGIGDMPVYTVSDGVDGKSAFELAVENGYKGSLSDWLESLKGKDGQNGANGKSAFELAVEKGYTGSIEDWTTALTGADGKSAYELAVECGYDGDLMSWIASLKGESGNDGKSAFELAVENGYTGTVGEWTSALSGKDGKSAFELAVENGFDGSFSEWLESLKGNEGADGLSAFELAVKKGFDGTEEDWIVSLKGQDGDDGMSGKSAYEVAVEAGFEGTKEEWLKSLEGKSGESAYDIAVAAGFKGTKAEWLSSLQGKSAYDIAVDNGFEGTEAEWLGSLGSIDQLSVGDHIMFGKYEQNGDSTDGKEDIEWIVLDKQQDKILLLTFYAIEVTQNHPFFDSSIPAADSVKRYGITWETSYLRPWLNGAFYDAAFSKDEKARIINSYIVTKDVPGGCRSSWSTGPIMLKEGNPTNDNVFILGFDEVKKYMPRLSDRICTYPDISHYGYGSQEKSVPWLLRNRGREWKTNAYVLADGTLSYSDGELWGGTTSSGSGIRPAIWIKLN